MFERQSNAICRLINDKTFFTRLIQGDQKNAETVSSFLKLLAPENLPSMQKVIAQWIELLQNVPSIGFEKASEQAKDLAPPCQTIEKTQEIFKENLVALIKKASQKVYANLWEMNPPTEFFYCDSFDAKSEKVNADVISKKLGFTFTNNVQFADPDQIGNYDYHFSDMQKVSARELRGMLYDSREHQKQIEIFRMGEKQGYAPRVKSGIIEKNRIVAMANGKSYVGKSHVTDDYSISHPSVIDPEVRFVANIHGKEGGLGFLFAHAPTTKKALQEYKMKDLSGFCTLEQFNFHNSIDEARIATANITIKSVLLERPHSQNPNVMVSTPIFSFITLRDITEGEVLCFDYEVFWWATRNAAFDLFYQNGKLLDPTAYTLKSYYVYMRFSDDEVTCAFNRDHLTALSQNSTEMRKKLGNIELSSEGGLYTAELKCETLLERFEKSPRACGIKLFEEKGILSVKRNPGQLQNKNAGFTLPIQTHNQADKRFKSASLRLFPLAACEVTKTLLHDGNSNLSLQAQHNPTLECDQQSNVTVMKTLLGTNLN